MGMRSQWWKNSIQIPSTGSTNPVPQTSLDWGRSLKSRRPVGGIGQLWMLSAKYPTPCQCHDCGLYSTRVAGSLLYKTQERKPEHQDSFAGSSTGIKWYTNLTLVNKVPARVSHKQSKYAYTHWKYVTKAWLPSTKLMQACEVNK